MDSIGVPISQFADNCGIPRPSMSQLLNGRNKRISDDVINKIHAAYPDLSILWLMFGEGEMTPAKNIEMSEPQNAESEEVIEGQPSDTEGFEGAFVQSLPFTDNQSENSSDITYPDNSLFEAPTLAQMEDKSGGSAAPKENISFGAQNPPSVHPQDITHTIYYPASADQQSSSLADAVNPAGNVHPFGGQSDRPAERPLERQSLSGQSDRHADQMPLSGQPERKVSITPDSRKKITNIVVFYSDNSFQSFIPDA